MALPILDGNQTATTLSTILTGGAHIPAHTVVSLGATAISNIASAVSGIPISGTVTANLGTNSQQELENIVQESQLISGKLNSVTIGSLPPISGTVTATVREGEDAIINDSASGYTTIRAQSHWFSDSANEVKVTSDNNPLPISGTVTVGNSITLGASSVTLNSYVAKRSDGSWHPLSVESGSNYVNARVYSPSSESFLATVTVGNPVTISNFPASQTVTGTVELGPTSLNALESITVTMGQVVVTGGLTDTQLRASAVTIGGTVTARTDIDAISSQSCVVGGFDSPAGVLRVGSSYPLPVSVSNGSVTANVGNIPDIMGSGYSTLFELLYEGSNIPIAGTVTANVSSQDIADGINAYAGSPSYNLPVYIDSGTVSVEPTGTSLPISGTVTANVGIASETDVTQFGEWIANGFNAAQPTISVIGNSSGQPFPISGTVTVGAVPNGSLTTRFGTPTTANTAFATSAVTNASRKYLLVQNVTTGSNVITVGVGFTPTTTQGIQLVAGAGITFESSYIPTGAVYVLSSVTASNFTILEA